MVAKDQIDKPSKPTFEYQILIGHVKRVMKEPFAGDGSKTARGHLQLIEYTCSLFKLAGIPRDGVKGKLLYLSFLEMLVFGSGL
jgi:hypothetical protein